VPQTKISGDPAERKRVYRNLTRAAVFEMGLGVVWLVFPIYGHGIFHVVGGIAIICGGLVILRISMRARRKDRDL
jgi:hypothetical protein